MCPNPLIEELAQKQFKYSKIFEDQAAILRKDPIVYQIAYDNVLKSEGVAKEGQQWMPKPDERDAYMKHLEGICDIEPKTPDDRMKICFAAHAYTACLVLLDIGKLSTKDQHHVIKRHSELQAAELANLPSVFMPPSLRPEPNLPTLGTHIRTQLHQITEEELRSFLGNPLDLLGKQFVLKAESEKDDLVYEVVKFGASKGKCHCYGVQFADCVSSVEMDSDEMVEHLRGSYLIDN